MRYGRLTGEFINLINIYNNKTGGLEKEINKSGYNRIKLK